MEVRWFRSIIKFTFSISKFVFFYFYILRLIGAEIDLTLVPENTIPTATTKNS